MDENLNDNESWLAAKDETISEFMSEDESIDKTGLLNFSETSLIGRNHHIWLTAKHNSRFCESAVTDQTIPGPAKDCENITDPLLCFKKFFDDKIINEIVESTNAKLDVKNTASSMSHKKTYASEIHAVLGLLILTGVMKHNSLSFAEIFEHTFASSTYLSVMSRNRFKTFIEFLRFENKSENACNSSDKFATVRKIWDLFFANCKLNYIPGRNLTIEEHFLSFNGDLSFKVFIPNATSTYGLKVMMLCDSKTKYLLNAIPYLGEDENTENIPITEYFVKQLTKPVHGLHKNITMDHKYTSVSLAKELLKEPYKLTIVGKLPSTALEIPQKMRNIKNRLPYTSTFCYDAELTLLSYKPKKGESMLYFLSSRNEAAAVNQATRKPLMLEFYKKTIAGPETFDAICNFMACNRKTRRWSMCVFYGILNMAVFNSYAIYYHNVSATGEKLMSRKEFAKKLLCSLVQEHITQRLSFSNSPADVEKNIQMFKNEIDRATSNGTCDTIENPGPTTIVIKTINKDSNASIKNTTAYKGAAICIYCSCKKRRMTINCHTCKNNVCCEHKIDICNSCVELITVTKDAATSGTILKFEIKDMHEFGKYRSNKKRDMCKFCLNEKRRLTKTICYTCKTHICGEHKTDICISCAKVLPH